MPQPRKYTLEDDMLIKDACTLAKKEGKSLDPVFEELGEMLERTKAAVEYRFYNVISKRKDEEPGSQTELFQFEPYTGDKSGKRVLRHYTPEEDQRIFEVVQIAEGEGLPMSAVFTKLAEDLDRTPKAVEVRANILKRRNRDDSNTDDESDDEDDGKGVLSKLRALVKERDFYKSKYESSEDKVKDYDRMAKELRQIRKLLD